MPDHNPISYMRTPKYPLLLAAAVFGAAVSFQSHANAQLLAYDDAGNYRVSANWTNGSNQGFGFQPWVIATNGPNSHGSYVGSANNPMFVIATITNFNSVNYTDIFGIYANGASGVNDTTAFRGFNNPLGTNTFKIQWGSRGAGNTTITGGTVVHGWCGFTLRNGNVTNSPTDFQTGARFYLYFQDGNNPSTLYIGDGSPNNPTSVPNTSFSDLGRQNITNAVEAEITVGADGNSYHLVLKDCVRNRTLYTLDSTLAPGTGTSVDSVALFCHETTGDQIYNHLQIATPTLIPPSIVNVEPTNGTLYLPPGTGTPVTFEVDSFNSTVASNFVTLTLNGVAQNSGLFSTTSPTTQLFATYTPNLVANTLYTMVITAQDANGNVVTNTSNFNTFLPGNLYVDASDYNYNGGQYIDNLAPTNGFTNLEGVDGVDFYDYTGTNNALYRPADQPQILELDDAITGDPIDHANERANNFTVYNVGFTDIGEWQNFTRTVPAATNYSIYTRAASGTTGQFEMDLLASATATASNQPYAALGRVSVPNTGGSKVYSGALTPVQDLFGNTVVINLSGTKTFRETAIASRVYNLEYFTLVPISNSTNTLRPYISVGSPLPNATGVALDSPVTFTVANRQTTVTNVQLSVNGVSVSVTTSNNSAGAMVTYIPTGFLPSNTTNNLVAIITDSAGVKLTNNWSFATLTALVSTLPGTNAQVSASGGTGFALHIYKVDDAAPTLSSITNAEMELSGTRTNLNTGLPYPNLDPGPNGDGSYTETNTINYDITGAPTGTPEFNTKSAFPLVPANAVNNNIAMQALMYLQLGVGSYHLEVRSDDGFKLTTGPVATDTNFVIGLFDGGRGNGTPSDLYFNVTNAGYYPMRLLYYQAGQGGNVEFYSLSNNVATLINDPTNPNSIKAFLPPATVLPVTLLNPAITGSTFTFSFLTQSSHTHYVEYKNTLSDPSWTPLQTITGNGTVTNVTDATASGASRFYHVRTQ